MNFWREYNLKIKTGRQKTVLSPQRGGPQLCDVSQNNSLSEECTINIGKFILQSLSIASILTLALVLWVPWVQSEISDVLTNPEQPTENDDIILSVIGWMPDSCWSYLSGEYEIQYNNIDISLYTYDAWFPGLVCALITLPYSEEFDIGKLENGIYFVTTTEYRDSLREPFPRYHYTNFTVYPANGCKGDFEPDGDVDGSDLSIFAADFGRTNCDTGPDCEGDFDTDNDSDGSDLAVFAADFGRTDCTMP